ncbi:NAD-dependent dehydratase [Rathayibacter tritici]|uniref:NAD-dependent dehydratase n=1 Tax=Rathayibacter tritici TaxID=33888 RepID=A0A160KV73_9MICO|nr:SDR family oxidoreductase [Rathayibacter tritici]AND17534.1 NAD-dependent dehydratase [Rathayibacter tritici]PPF29895.1 NAD-dependent dehydratase [Rathayibacter tritici]PPF65291.1 NAD-dependent dehydratase [Rathayibacter tritici]PPG06047.1 NAD-dependent dehydratase [Rathayibacter tritici]PPI19906.1 NAD-dependent dehydratase [Rathayibacter tritici]
MPSSTPVSPSDSRNALVVGATGIGGSALVDLLSEQGWPVTALSRRPIDARPGVTPLAADLRSAEELARVLADQRPTHVFFTAWSRQATEEENIAVNGGMVRDLLAALTHAPVEHVALVTGLKHYLGPFEAYGQGAMPDTPFHEEEERLDAPNFYYAQEDELFAAADRAGFTWSVHRSHTVIGHAVGNAMNMGLTLAVAASIHRAENTPFVFPGSLTQWNGLTDMTDATILAEQMLWASTSEAGRDEAFNVVNGDVFRWRWMWTRIAEYFGVEPVGPGEVAQPLEQQMVDAQPVWERLVEERGLVESDLARVVSWWHTDADLGRQIEVVTDIGKSRLAGFSSYHRTVDSFTALFDRSRAERLIP